MDKPVAHITVCIKGAGEMASAVAWRLYRAHIRRICMLEVPGPLAVRRRVSFCEAVYAGSQSIEGVTAVLTSDDAGTAAAWEAGRIAVRVDPEGESIRDLGPDVVIDAILAKRNLGTDRDQAPLVIGLGPGFTAGHDVHAVIETNRGHDLGRIITHGRAEPNTGIPGRIAGFASRRVLRAPVGGRFQAALDIGQSVKTGDVVGRVNNQPVCAAIDGILRGLIRSGTQVTADLKLGDIDPRGIAAYCDTISDKARAISGSVLEMVLRAWTAPADRSTPSSPSSASHRAVPDELADRVAGILGGRVGVIAAAIRAVENQTAGAAPLIAALREHIGNAHRIGITGPPGVGKSTFLGRLIGLLRAAHRSVGVIAVDPSSAASGGALLADRLRIPAANRDSDVFIRSMATRGRPGGLADQAEAAADILDAAGKDVILFETVGVGQTDYDITAAADTVIALTMPGAGDVIQGMKAGLMEVGDIFVVNKADLPGARAAQADLEMVLSMRPPPDNWKRNVWLVDSRSGAGLEDVYADLAKHRKFLQQDRIKRHSG
jgi:xanthine dehydrogenase accessory factor